MIQSDSLSRRPDHCLDSDEDNKETIMLPDQLFVNLIDLDFQKRIAESRKLDKEVADALKTILDEGLPAGSKELGDWTMETDSEGRKAMFYRGKLYIPSDIELRRDAVKMHHDSPLAGHPGQLETFNKIKEQYWWPGMKTFV